MTTAKNPNGGKPNEPETDGKKPETDGKKPETDGKKPETDGKKPETDGKKPETDGKKPEVVRHHVQHDNGGHQGDDAANMVTKWATAGAALVLFLLLALGLAWAVTSFVNKAPVAATAQLPTPPVRMVDVSGPDPSATYTPPPAPAPAPAYVPKVQKVARDPWANDLVTKPTFVESGK